MSKGYLAVDLDGTLAHYKDWATNGLKIGDPIPNMLKRVKKWITEGKEVRIFTARVNPERPELELQRQRALVANWSIKHFGRELRATAIKDYSMIELWDDRAVRVQTNTGRILSR